MIAATMNPAPAARPAPLLRAAVPALALALPFVFGITRPPNANFWPLMASAACAWAIAALAWAGAGPRARLAQALAAGLLLAALLGGAIGLAQYFLGDADLAPWVRPSSLGQAIGNLRQRNQQATLVALGAWALLWWLGRLQQRACQPAPGAPAWLLLALAALAPAALALLAAAGAATVSRTGATQWLLMAALLLLWRRGGGALALAAGALGLAAYGLAAWGLPELLARSTGAPVESLFTRVAEGSSHHPCASRLVLWANVAQLIAERPWAGWGWGELDYAHYITPFEGPRFCQLLDNAHNLPLHLAVELGLPAAVLALAAAGGLVWRARPWRETQPGRQLAWGVLALIGLHSLLEFPLWYGPFQLAAALALWLLAAPWLARRWLALAPAVQRGLHAGAGLALVLALVLAARLVHDYRWVSALYRAEAGRPAAVRALGAAGVARSVWFFRDPAEFAWLTTTPASPGQAAELHAAAQRLLHYSPEPRVIEKLIASARLLGLAQEAALHTDRYARAWPRDFAAWQARQASGRQEPAQQ